jgi:AcrR family transcriptional regulator
MAETGTKRKTQAQRRAESSQAVLDSAIRLFGAHGYADTSLEQIAADCGLTIRPIYHYFGNKKALFAAVNDIMEQRILDSMQVGDGGGFVDNWRAFLDLCDDPAFRQVVLVDSPNVLGRERWATASPVHEKARGALAAPKGESGYRAVLVNRVLMSAFTEVALMIAEAEDVDSARKEAEALMGELFTALMKRR